MCVYLSCDFSKAATASCSSSSRGCIFSKIVEYLKRDVRDPGIYPVSLASIKDISDYHLVTRT